MRAQEQEQEQEELQTRKQPNNGNILATIACRNIVLACIRISYAYQASIRMIRMLACIRISYAYQVRVSGARMCVRQRQV